MHARTYTNTQTNEIERQKKQMPSRERHTERENQQQITIEKVKLKKNYATLLLSVAVFSSLSLDAAISRVLANNSLCSMFKLAANL